MWTLWRLNQTSARGFSKRTLFCLIRPHSCSAGTPQVCTELAAAVPALARVPGFEALAQQLLSYLMLEHFHVRL